MDGVFMIKSVKRVGFCLLLAVSVWTGSLLADHRTLGEGLIRFHIVANSDAPADQSIKLQVRDAVISSLRDGLSEVSDVEAAKDYLQENLPGIAQTANNVLKEAGFRQGAVVSLSREAFEKREYDTFTLPAGVYESLRIVIGEGEGHNWWCVAFPSLCVPVTQDCFADTAVSAGFSETLADTLTEEHEIRFFFLDTLGKLENILFKG